MPRPATCSYELDYTAKDPLVLGIGYAATRDLNSFLRYEAKDRAGTANPMAKQIRCAISEGNSQSGNFLRSYIHLGFNQDEANRIVWDGSNPHIAVRQLAMNYRFAVAGGTALLYEPGSDGVLWWGDYPMPHAALPPACWIVAAPRIPAPRSSRPSAASNSGIFACPPISSAPTRRRHSPSSQRSPLLLSFHHPRRRPRRLHRHSRRDAQRLRAPGQSEP